ncbi:MAG TPA: hypothetical protein VH593_14110 [Ktedonobacteraceae bacterium]
MSGEGQRSIGSLPTQNACLHPRRHTPGRGSSYLSGLAKSYWMQGTLFLGVPPDRPGEMEGMHRNRSRIPSCLERGKQKQKGISFMETPTPRRRFRPEDFERLPKTAVSRRSLLKLGLAASAAATIASIDALAWAPKRLAHAATTSFSFPDIQFDIGNFIAPVQTIDGIPFRFGPVYTVFLTAQLTRTPSRGDQADLENALETIEEVYPFSPRGIFTFVAYGLPYFRKLPGGLTGSLVSNNMPRLLSDTSRFALEEAVPSPTDVSSQNPNISKATFNVPVKIESNDVNFTFRSDSLDNINDVINWLTGSDELGGFFIDSPNFAFTGLFNYTTIRTEFVQMGLPRNVANENNLPYAVEINPQTPMWMGFSDQQVAAAGPALITTFQGNSSAHFTTATSGSYFDNGSIQHLSHVILDLKQFYNKNPNLFAGAEPYTERVQYMFRSDSIPSLGNSDQYTNGGGTAFLTNDSTIFLSYQAQGTTEAIQTAASPNTVNSPQPDGSGVTPRMGHLSALQQSSRATDGTPIHIRMDGPGFSAGDVPNGTQQPKLQFTVFVPSADFFRSMRTNQAALNFQALEAGKGGSPTGTVDADDNGLERFLTATRRQNFLTPPRRHRSFPLTEFTNTTRDSTAPSVRQAQSLKGVVHL